MNNEQTLYDRVIERLNLKSEGNGKKPFYKSVRFGYDVFKAIDSVEGDSFNEVFNNICTTFIDTIPEREAKVKELDRKIKEKQKLLEKLDKTLRDMQWLSDGVVTLQSQLKRVNGVAESLINSASKNP